MGLHAERVVGAHVEWEPKRAVVSLEVLHNERDPGVPKSWEAERVVGAQRERAVVTASGRGLGGRGMQAGDESSG